MTSTAHTNGTPTMALARVERTETALAHEDSAPPTFEGLVAMGEKLLRTGILPEHVKTGAHAAAIIMTGREMGMMPMQSLRSLQVVKGKVVEAADSQLARFKQQGGRSTFTHNRCGVPGCKAATHLDDVHASLLLTLPNGDDHVETWTDADVKAAGLGDMHRKHPKAMKRSRVITAGLKSIGWLGAVGNYDPDEAREFTINIGEAPAQAPAAPTSDAKEQLRALQQSAIVELDRLKVGEGMTGDDLKTARRVVLERMNDGKPPKTLTEWSDVLADLRAEATPARSDEPSVPSREPGADDDATT